MDERNLVLEADQTTFRDRAALTRQLWKEKALDKQTERPGPSPKIESHSLWNV